MTTDPDDLHALVARHFDGELTAADSERALDHLTVCAQCQAELGDLVGLEVALSRAEPSRDAIAPPPTPITTARRRRWGAPVALVGALAAAAAVVVVVRGRSAGPAAEAPALALASTRAVEVRFTAPAFAQYRPYEVQRGGATAEALPLEALAQLERRGDRATLAAAQASGGEVAAARRVLEGMAPGPGRDADLAALDLLAGHAEDALVASERALAGAPTLAAAQWNRALALHRLVLGLVAAAALDGIVALGEPGWADEANAKVTAWRAALAERGPAAVAFTAAARAMVDRTGPTLTSADAVARPGLTRLYFHDALRGAADAAEARALAPLAAELDRQVGNGLATTEVTRVAGLPASAWAVRAPLARAYRDLALGRATDGGAALVARLERAPTAMDDLKLGALVLAGGPSRAAEIERLVAATADPWFELMAVRDRGRALLNTGALDRAEVVLRGGYARCDGRMWAHRCAHLAIELFTLYASQTRYAEAEAFAGEAVRQFRASGATELEDQALSFLAEAERGRGRLALASATFQEVLARVGDRDCVSDRYARSGLVMLAGRRGLVTAGVTMPAPDACGLPPNPLELGAVIDLARATGRADDRQRADAWIAAARAAGEPTLAVAADVAADRLALPRDPAAAGRLRETLGRLAGADDLHRALRGWAYQSLIEDAGRRGQWADAVALVAEDLAVTPPTRCALAVSVDDDRGTAVALDAQGRAIGAQTQAASPVAWDGETLVPAAVRTALAGCAQVQVLARPPLQGRTDLLPPAMAWAFGAGVEPRPLAAPGKVLAIGDVVPPAELGLPALAPLPVAAGETALRGAAATPAAVLAALADATYAELHVHGQVDLAVADASFLALSPGANGGWALTAAEVRRSTLAAAPVVVLAACRAAEVAPFEHARWSLPDAFLAAGARAVIAPAVDIPDAEAGPFFDAVRTRILGGEAPAVAVAAERAAAMARGQRWAASVVVFE